MNDGSSDNLIGERFGKDGRLVIEAKLGEGGVGMVYRALDSQSGERLAIKFLRPEFAEADNAVSRFKREGDRFAALTHPNIVRVHGLGREHGMLYLACDFVEGRTLGSIVRRDGPMEPQRALQITRDIAAALQAAHEKNVVHRDLKPENIMIRSEDGQVVLLDFGIAKPMDSKSLLTRAGTYLGTPGYSAPEQVRGQPVDHRADIFPLGVILYEMLTGKAAFEGKTTRQVLISTLQQKPPPVLKINDSVGKPLARLIDRMIEKNPAKRFQTMVEVIQAIDALDNVAPGDRMGRAGVFETLRRFFST